MAVTTTNCGASTAVGSAMVTVPVYVPAVNDAVCNAIAIGMQGPLREQVVELPTVGASQLTDEVAVRLSVPVPRLPANRFWVAPADPGTVETVKAVCVRTSLGAACNAAAPSRRNNPNFAKENFSRTTYVLLLFT